MPYLHGFRRIIFEYQPLVDEILRVVGLQEPNGEAGEESRTSEIPVTATDSVALQRLLEREAQSPFYEEAISYALFKVAEAGLVTAAEKLLTHGADLNFEDPVTYYSALHVAVLRNQPDMVELLVQHGADINKRDRVHNSSPLDLASEEVERLPCLQRLLDLGANVNGVDRTGKSALLHALASSDGVQVHNIDNIKLLLERGADVKAIMMDGDNVFTFIVFLLGETEGRDQEEAETLRRFCLHTTQLLLAHSAKPDACQPEDSLIYTCINQFEVHLPIIQVLLDSGASNHCPDHGPSCWSGFTLLFERLRTLLNGPESGITHREALHRAGVALELMLGNATRPWLPLGWEIKPTAYSIYTDQVLALSRPLKLLELSPASLKHLCRVDIRRLLRPVPLDPKVKALPLPDRLKWFLLMENGKDEEEGVQQ
ncbi:ankyrin repeat and SOCS box protein 6 [Pristis pectinata]|uniref:ankyrin repeat and SOCS box protein 6 n=1 Tax=Pristis pectinata TaxID=685728 RepID=UPI00223E520E|nr:ankyrin repeat and SOCS box protein 6 [Pristis pectinata]XP_051893344.1 ankyrin repeat and SOCS box protein 6 [Pristis pectinata]XP_051893345.1 ankyrin repeat and SOCS box protein 6 [Pristis pectinata]XP_051893346.1 ankyrin repeat and SOCS box protein 6 [Pristis pectinata]XP_051893347.1 ankyrin repeat and SOCS box protein 6 [Pristis pectinata]XP_051893348.1 ankyrin repeat and SOCS box protein 6 [Pristis pectinata]